MYGFLHSGRGRSSPPGQNDEILAPFHSEDILTVRYEPTRFLNPRIDYKDTPNAHVFKADLPGLNKNEVRVEIEEDDVLCVSGKKRVEKEEKTDRWHRVERSSGKFMRRLRLPENSKVEKINASFHNGALTVTVPKKIIDGNHKGDKHHVGTIEVHGP